MWKRNDRRTRYTKNSRIRLEPLEPRLLLAADGQLDLGPLQFLPGDIAEGPAEGHQMDAVVAQGGTQSLAVWSDYRSSPDDYPPFATESLGADVYGRVLDADGNAASQTIIINQEFGDQEWPEARWNGQNWLVVWKTSTSTLPTYEKILAARVAPDGMVLDETPIEVQNNQSYYGDFEPFKVASDGTDWVVMFQASGQADGVHAIRVAADGTIPNPNATLVHATLFNTEFDIAFAQDEYLITWTDGFSSPPSRGRRFTTDLQPAGNSFTLPGADDIATDGTDFLVTWTANGPGAWKTLKGIVTGPNGPGPFPQTLDITVQPNVCCTDVVWDGANYWATWGGLMTARVSANGTVLDPNGFTIGAVGQYSVPLRLDAAPGGGMQLVWNDGDNGAVFPKDVYGTRVSADAQLATDVLLSSGAPAQLNADFAEGPNMFAVAFESRVSGLTSIKVQRLDANGTALDAEPIEVASGPNLSIPGVAFDGFRYLVTWQDGNHIFAQRMAIDGSLQGTSFEIMTGLTPDVAGNDGTFLVVGTHYRNTPQERVVFTRRVDGATGSLLDATPQEIGSFVIFSQFPRVVSFGERWLVTWQTNRSHDDPVAGTKGAFVDPDGTSPGAFEVGLGWRPDVAVADDRALFVAVSDSVASATTDLQGRIMLADGSFPAPAFTISSAPDKQLAPAVTFDGENFLVAWEDKRESVIYFDERTAIYGTRVSTSGDVLDVDSHGAGGIPMTPASDVEVDAALVSSGGTTLFATSTLSPTPGLNAFRIGISEFVMDIRGDFNGDQTIDAQDIDLLFGEIRSGTNTPLFDLTGNGLVDSEDMDELILNVLGTLYGDASLDGIVDGNDFILWNANRFQAGGWSQGDFDGNLIVDGEDFLIWNAYKFQTGSGLIPPVGSPAPFSAGYRLVASQSYAVDYGAVAQQRWHRTHDRHRVRCRRDARASDFGGSVFRASTWPTCPLNPGVEHLAERTCRRHAGRRRLETSGGSATCGRIVSGRYALTRERAVATV